MSDEPMIRPPRRMLGVLVVAALGAAGCASRVAAEGERIVEVLGIEAGMTVADVGAGDGEWSEVLARAVGEAGHLYATEVKPRLVEELEELGESLPASFTAVLGDQERSGLPAACCDVILLRMVYHHFEEPGLLRADLWRSLRPGGLIGIIDIEPQKGWRELPDVPERGGHGIPMEDLILEMGRDGFEQVARHAPWSDDEDRYCVVFRRPGDS